jgi:hypothetical protein
MGKISKLGIAKKGIIKKETIMGRISKKGIIIKARKEAKKGRISKKGITVLRIVIICILG